MHTALDAPVDALDPDERRFVAQVREQGWFRTEVFGDDRGPGFSYTTGFEVNAGRPELIVFGLGGGVAHDVLWDLFRDARAGGTLALGTRAAGVFGNAPAYIFPVAARHYRDHLGWSLWFHGGDGFRCSQLLWPDRAGTFPWEDGFDPSLAGLQPDLTERGWPAAVLD